MPIKIDNESSSSKKIPIMTTQDTPFIHPHQIVEGISGWSLEGGVLGLETIAKALIPS